MTHSRYAANQVIQTPTASSSSSQSAMAQGNSSTLVDVAKDVATDLAKEFAQGLYYLGTPWSVFNSLIPIFLPYLLLGDMGRKTVSNYLYPEEPNSSNISFNPGNGTVISTNTPLSPVDSEHAGTVSYFTSPLHFITWQIQIIVYDIVSKKNILHFRAHSQALSALKFDPSGTLVPLNFCQQDYLINTSTVGHSLSRWTRFQRLPNWYKRKRSESWRELSPFV